ncbi:MAG: hypothetical protein LBC61_06665 [Candidatus Peribacteria bacterium]|jgi:hypothetical protein|nr:hypothetical protein [Candidatus Peribacteria bacterium]
MRESVCWYDSRRLVGNSLRCALLNDAANYTGNVTAFKSVMTKAKQLYDKDCK